MKILFYSCHEILEFDLVKLFTEAGHEVFSLGVYQNSNQGILRGPIPGLYDNAHLRGVALQCSKENTHEELFQWCDVVFMMHNSRAKVEDHPQPWLKGNWDTIKRLNKPCVWYSIGQSNAQIEKALHEFKGLKIVRYSPKEETIPSYAGSSAMIRFYKDPEEYKDYNGQNPRIVNLSQALFGSPATNPRGDHMALDFFKQVVDGFEWKVFGPDNENAGEHNGGSLSFEDLKQMLRFNRVFFYTGTRPASYTLAFVEAMLTGIPVVSIGPEHGNEIYTDQKTFEAHELLGDGGYWSDSFTQCRKYLADLLNNHQMALEMGAKGRARAIELFGKQTIMEQWRSFFAGL